MCHVGGLAHDGLALDDRRSVVDAAVRIGDASVFAGVVHARHGVARSETTVVSGVPPAHVDETVASTLTASGALFLAEGARGIPSAGNISEAIGDFAVCHAVRSDALVAGVGPTARRDLVASSGVGDERALERSGSLNDELAESGSIVADAVDDGVHQVVEFDVDEAGSGQQTQEACVGGDACVGERLSWAKSCTNDGNTSSLHASDCSLRISASGIGDGTSGENDEDLLTIHGVGLGEHLLSLLEGLTDVAGLRRNPALLEVCEISGDFDIVTSDATPRSNTIGSEGGGVAKANETDTLTSQGRMRSCGVRSASGGPVSLEEEISETLITTRVGEEGLIQSNSSVEEKNNIEVVTHDGVFVVAHTIVPHAVVVLDAVAGTDLVGALGIEATSSVVGERSGASDVEGAGVRSGVATAASSSTTTRLGDSDVGLPFAAEITIAILFCHVSAAVCLLASAAIPRAAENGVVLAITLCCEVEARIFENDAASPHGHLGDDVG